MENRILNKDRLLSHGNRKAKAVALDILEAGLQAADPYNNMKELMHIEKGKLYIGNPLFTADGDPKQNDIDIYQLDKIKKIFVFGWGKGVQRAAKAIEDILGNYLTGGHIVAKHGDEVILNKCGVTLAGHPIPDENCVAGCLEIISICEKEKFDENDLVITLVGNGVSSLMTLPIEGIALNDVKEVTRILQIEFGLPTMELNYIRNHLDRLKGGRINRFFGNSNIVNIACIDVNRPISGSAALGYGYNACVYQNVWIHTFPDSTSVQGALDIIDKWKAAERLPGAIVKYLKNTASTADSMKAEEFLKLKARIFGLLPISLAPISACKRKAEELGFATHLLTRRYHCDAAAAGFLTGNIAVMCNTEAEPFSPPCVIIAAGELIVAVGESKGVGGRNQEFSLSAALAIEGNENIAIAAVDTDGTDGPGGLFNAEASREGVTCLAGGVIDGTTLQEAKQAEIDIFESIRTHSTSNLLWRINSGIVASHNISYNDLHVTVIMDRCVF